ncbi:unnamed protein product, partial [Polarella glacialis]
KTHTQLDVASSTCMNRAVDAACAELRRLAVERRKDWSSIPADESAASRRDERCLREDWRSWREESLLSSLSAQSLDGHRVLLQALLCDMLAGYEELLGPRFVADLALLPRASDSAIARLQEIANAAHRETDRLLVGQKQMEVSSRSPDELTYLAVALYRSAQRCGDATPGTEGLAQKTAASPLAFWDSWYAEAETRFEQRTVVMKAKLLNIRRSRAAKTIARGLRSALCRRATAAAALRARAAVSLQRAFREVWRPRIQRLRQALEKGRRSALLWRLHRRLRRYARSWRIGRQQLLWADPGTIFGGADAAVRIQAFCRGRWSRNGWSYCWSPPFQRPLCWAARSRQGREALPVTTAFVARGFAVLRSKRRARQRLNVQCRAWLPLLQAERLILSSWRTEEHRQTTRAAVEAHNQRRFEVQWKRYEEGLSSFVRVHSTERSRHGKCWVSTVDSSGHPVWLNELTGRTRSSDPVESRVAGNIARERKKAESRFDEQMSSMQEVWAEEDLAGAADFAASSEELTMLARDAFETSVATKQLWIN